MNNDFSKYDFDKVLIGNISHIKEFEGKEIYTDNSLNVFNSYTCEYLKQLGVKGVNLSFELNLEQLKEINDKQKLNLTIYQNAGGQIAIDFTGYQTDDKSRNKALNLLLRGLTNAQQMKFEEDILQGKKYEDFVEAKTKFSKGGNINERTYKT